MFARIPYQSKATDVVVIYANKTKALAWVLDKPADSLIQSTERKIISASAEFFQRYQVSSPKQYEKVLPFITLKKGAIGSCVVDDRRVKGVITSINQNGVSITTKKYQVRMPWHYVITPETSLKMPLALKEWSAKNAKSKKPHHDGGYCQKIDVYRNNKRVMVWEEDAWSGSPEITLLNNDVDHKADLILAMKHALQENEIIDELGIYSSIDCSPQYLIMAKYCSLKEWVK